MKKTPFFLAVGVIMCVAFGAQGAAPSPVGKRFPSVRGSSLAGREVRFPDDLLGKPSVLLVAYRRGTQPDVNRWLELLSKGAPGVAKYEVPTIANPVWRPLSGWIDSGMKGGVPEEKWAVVVTLYEDAPPVRDFLGDYGGLTTHVVLLDGEGRVAWFDAGGFTEKTARALLDALAALGPGAAPTGAP